MGFNLRLFLEELEYRIKSGYSHTDILKYIEEQKKYAKECGQL